MTGNYDDVIRQVLSYSQPIPVMSQLEQLMQQQQQSVPIPTPRPMR